jgi:catechol 2,3-dioxygenase-like lactoylglutathione lyase family enzyme
MIGFIHHATVRVADVDEALARYHRLLGLTGARHGDRALLRCAYEDFCLDLVPAGPGETPGVEHVAYELEKGVALEQAADRLAAHGVAAHEVDVPLRGRGLRVEDPAGNGVVVLERVIPEDRTPPVFRYTDVLPGLHPRRFQHVNYLCADVGALVDFYTRALGFGVTDWIGDGAVWLHCNRDHHALAFLDKGYDHLHHLAFELVDWGELRVALDHLAQHRRNVVWGPGRHTMAQNLFAYWRMVEEEHFIELFCDMEQLEADHEPRRFPDDPHASNAWGILPPRSYFRFDADAVQSELEQREALRG